MEGTKNDGSPIIFSEWQLLPAKYGIQKDQRREQTFNSILNENEEENCSHSQFEELSLFLLDEEEAAASKTYSYVPVKITDIYKELMTED